MDEAAARRLTLGIQLRLETIAANVEQVIPLIEQARDGNAHEALGYESWTAYVQHKFGGRLARLQRAERRPIVELLSATGMSTRAIGSVVGVHHDTVASDIRAASAPVGNPTPAVRDILGDDAAEIMALADNTDEEFEDALTAAKAGEDVSRENVVSKLGQRQITGRDGKSYTVQPPAPPKQRRRPLPDAYRDAVYDLEKVVARLDRLHEDDRFPANREGLRAAHRARVVHLVNELLDIQGDLCGDAQ